mgnify:FL=1
MMNYAEESLKLHYALRGKLEITPRAAVDSRDALSLAYTPGVAQPCLEIQKDINKSYELTRRWNTVAVVTDGTAVLGLGDIGPEAGMPVMEGKCVLFKAFGGVDAIPLCLRTKDPDEIVRTIALLAGSFGGINLEDISAPRCFDIEQRLQAAVDIPVFHDDQHGTAVIVLAGLTNALKVAGKDKSARIVINGAGAAGLSVCRLLLSAGYTDITLCDKQGILCPGVTEDMNPYMAAVCERTNPRRMTGKLADALAGADVFLGFSAPRLVTSEMVRTMADNAIIFACANPTPEITPEEAHEGGALVVASGRSDYPNQVNNVSCFPGLFRGALDVRASRVTEGMKLAAARAIAGLVPDEDLNADYILPAAFDSRLCGAVAAAVAEAARQDGVARI